MPRMERCPGGRFWRPLVVLLAKSNHRRTSQEQPSYAFSRTLPNRPDAMEGLEFDSTIPVSKGSSRNEHEDPSGFRNGV